MRETQRNIRNYQKRLVGVKEKLATAGLLFLMSAVMLTTASFAWITLSVAPEVSNISTTIVGNGNLEIALVTSDENGLAKLPEASQVGDSNKNLVEKNITWGNLINLNDNSYGLNKIVLRPATLNTSSTLDSPLRAVEYSKDGRIQTMNYDFSYSNYDIEEEKFVIDSITEYGVRAISSVLITASGEDAERNVELRNDLIASLETSKQTYTGLVTNKEYLDSIAGLMGVFLTDQLNNSDSNVKSYMPTFYKMVQEFDKAMTELGETYVKIANIQITKLNLTMNSYTSLNELLNESQSTLSSKNIKLMTGFDTFKRDYNNLKTHMANIEATLSKDSVLLDSIFNDINFMVEIDTCKIDDTFTVAQMGNMGMGDLLGMLSGTHKGVIQGGALQRYEQLTGAKMDAKNITISAKYSGIPASVKANISTSAAEPFTVPQLIEGNGRSVRAGEYSCILDIIFGNSQMIETAADVYGMTIDFWVRTNMENSYLILEGKPEIVYEVLTTSSNYIVYENEDGRQFYHIPDKDHPAPNPASIDPMESIVYKVDDTVIVDHYLNYGNFYGLETNQPVLFTELDEEDDNGISDSREIFVSLLKYSPKTVVTGYDGVNRIWEESSDLVEGTSTTQGKGSSFVFYPEDPLEQARMLNILSALSVAFIDDAGNVLARASLNPEHAYEEVGKVTVPLELTSESNFIVDGDNNEIHYVTALSQNEAHFISAIVYIDGEMMENEDVNATSSITGYLNLQFGSTEELISIEDDKLKNEYVVATAKVDKNLFEVTEIPASTNVTVDINGISTAGKTVYVNFVRQVNEHQGVQLEPLPLTLNSSTEDSSTLIGTQVFNRPGTYVLNSVWIEGIEYELEQKVKVEIEGFKINTLTWDQPTSDVFKMTSANNYMVSLSANVAASEQFRPSEMQAMFRNEYNEYVTVYMSESSGIWSGTGNFITSGKYQLEYLVINGDIYDIGAEFKKTINLVLGIYASVELDYALDEEEAGLSNITFEWDAKDKSKNVVDIAGVKVFDNKGNIIESLDGVNLYYRLAGSTNTDIYAELVWNASKESYTGKLSSDGKAVQFLISNPGIYSFNRIFIEDTSTETENDGSEIRYATAPSITAISPYPIELYENSLTAEEYQFAPDNKASFSVDMKYASTASVVAKMIYKGSGDQNVTYYVPGIVKSNIVDTNMTTWEFRPFVGSIEPSTYPLNPDGTIKSGVAAEFNYSQDGQWILEDIRLANVYAEDGDGEYKWYSITEEKWWISETDGSYVLWDVGDRNTDVLGKIIVNASSANRSQPVFHGDFSESLSGAYNISAYTISYSDNIGRTVGSEASPLLLSNWNLAISAELGYTYSSSNDDALKSGGWLVSVNGSAPDTNAYRTEMEKQLIDFTETTDTIVFKYPGTYSPLLSVSLSDLSGNIIEKTSSVSGNTINMSIISNLNTETVSWNQPDARFTNISNNNENRNVCTAGGGWLTMPSYDNSYKNSYDTTNNTINAYWSGESVKYYIYNYNRYPENGAPVAEITLSHGGNYKSASITFNNSKSSNVFNFTAGNMKASSKIGQCENSSGNDTLHTVAANTKVDKVTIVTDYGTFVFRIAKELTVLENK
ncbi:MAG: hypothetical protein IKU28_01215 [Erysipelotrichaceae bacterium]|nr:hypothetical protein [Erysipelotrichaceae bacterium]